MDNLRGQRSKVIHWEDCSNVNKKELNLILSIINKSVPKEILRLYKIHNQTNKFRIRKKLWNRIKKEYNRQPKVIGVDIAKEDSDFSCKNYMRKVNDKWIVEKSEVIK